MLIQFEDRGTIVRHGGDDKKTVYQGVSLAGSLFDSTLSAKRAGSGLLGHVDGIDEDQATVSIRPSVHDDDGELSSSTLTVGSPSSCWNRKRSLFNLNFEADAVSVSCYVFKHKLLRHHTFRLAIVRRDNRWFITAVV